MSKKDFKGMTRSILGGNVKSIADFLEPEKDKDTAAAENHDTVQKEPETLKIDASKPLGIESQEQQVTEKETQNSLPEDNTYLSADANITEDEKVRVTFYLSMEINYQLEDLKTAMRRMAPRRDFNKISKSSIVEAAIGVVATELRENGLDSRFAKMILKN
ncbi:MAG: hypothetical protein VR64_14595 [Desulfatitalea sp. BRH_c12]|nr:MAG: hypothetical protein VR64_14595 [Desulfatitalea sp. BRH_c12]